jgi:Protein of unknown function (DUF1488)
LNQNRALIFFDAFSSREPVSTSLENALKASSIQGDPAMALTAGAFGDYDYNRMVVRFTMKNDGADVTCAISTDAMDQLEGSSRTPPEQREQQFMRLRDRIEARAALKFSDVELEGNPPGVILRAIDFRPPRK